MKQRSDVARVGLGTALILCLLSSWSSRARAAEPPPAPAAAPATAAPVPSKAEARQRFDLGIRLFEKGENAAALAEFQRAYELIPNLTVLYNMGLVLAAMGRPVEALDALDKVLGEPKAPLSAEQRRHATEVRAEQATRVARLVVLTDRPATLELDGVEVGHTPLAEPLRVPSGQHVVSALAPGCLPARKQLTLAGQVTETLSFTMLPTENSVAHLALTVPVPGVQVLVDGQQVGVTPLAASLAVRPGSTRIELRRAGYVSVARELHLDEGATGALALTLAEDPAAPASMKGRLRPALSEAGAELTVDGASRPLTPDGVALLVGPHNVRIARAGFEPFERAVEIAAGRDLVLAVDLVPTMETRNQGSDAARSRRMVGWSIVAAGGAVAAASVIYTVATRNAVSNADAQLRMQLTKEADPNDDCYAMELPGLYMAHGCAATKAGFQDQVDSAKLKRILGYAGAGLGVVAVGVGTYFVVTGHEADSRPVNVGFWSDGASTGLSLRGSF